jgi:nucleotide-binding universal stress UspA family protein
LEGDPVESLRLRTRDGSLLVVGQDVDPRDQRHDRVASRLSALAAGPLVVVPPAHPAHSATAAALASSAVGAAMPARPHVVVGIDGTHAAIDALRFAAGEARELGAHLVAVHVWAEPMTLDNVFVGSADLDRLLQHQHEELLEESIEVGLVDYPDVDVLRRVIRGRAAVELTRLSRDADLLVVGDHGRGTIARHLLGSVSATLAAQPVVPTAIVHHPSDEPAAAAAHGRTRVEA